MRRLSTIAAVAGALLCAGLGAADAQPQPAPQPPAALDPKACAPGERLQQGERGPQAPPGAAGEPTSDKLARTDGVLCPPNVDPGIQAPTPDVGRTPVIPPPGSPGGDPTVRPK